MLAEEALIKNESLGHFVLKISLAVYPVLIAVVTPAVLPVLHDVPCAHLLLLVDLPEDNVSPACGSDSIVLIDALQSGRVEVQLACAVAGEPLPEGALGRVALSDQLLRKREQRRRRRHTSCQLRVHS